MALAAGQDLGCNSPQDTEHFLKACKRGEILKLTECHYEKEDQFLCTDILGKSYFLNLLEMNNFFCVTAAHRFRIIERCKQNG